MTPVSVVIPLYNKAASIARAIGSVLDQLHADDELIVIDDGSTDGSARVAARELGGSIGQVVDTTGEAQETLREELDGVRVRLLHQSNSGVAVARNRGVEAARHEHVAFLDADDRWCEGARAAFAELLKRWPQAWGYSLGHSRADPQTVAEDLLPVPAGLGCPQRLAGAHLIRHYARYPGLISASSVILRSSVLKEIGGFPELATNGEDVAVWLAVALAGGSFAVDPKPYVAVERAVNGPLPPLRRQRLPEHLARYCAPEALELLPEDEKQAMRFLLHRNGLRHVAGNILRGSREDGWVVARRLAQLGPVSFSVAALVCLMPRWALQAAYRQRQRRMSRAYVLVKSQRTPG